MRSMCLEIEGGALLRFIATRKSRLYAKSRTKIGRESTAFLHYDVTRVDACPGCSAMKVIMTDGRIS